MLWLEGEGGGIVGVGVKDVCVCIYLLNHFIGYRPIEQIPHVFPGARRMYPYYPHDVPHEFLSFQFPSTTPTRSAIAFIFVPQFENTPLS